MKGSINFLRQGRLFTDIVFLIYLFQIIQDLYNFLISKIIFFIQNIIDRSKICFQVLIYLQKMQQYITGLTYNHGRLN